MFYQWESRFWRGSFHHKMCISSREFSPFYISSEFLPFSLLLGLISPDENPEWQHITDTVNPQPKKKIFATLTDTVEINPSVCLYYSIFDLLQTCGLSDPIIAAIGKRSDLHARSHEVHTCDTCCIGDLCNSNCSATWTGVIGTTGVTSSPTLTTTTTTTIFSKLIDICKQRPLSLDIWLIPTISSVKGYSCV